MAASVQVLYMANEPNSIHIRAHRKERLRATAGHCGAKPSLAPAAPAAIPESLAMQQNPSELLIKFPGTGSVSFTSDYNSPYRPPGQAENEARGPSFVTI